MTRRTATAGADDTALVRERLGNQRLGQRLGRDGAAVAGAPAEVVRWMGAVQAQDFAGGVWAVGMRCTPSGITAISESDVEAAIAARSIVRSWPMRGTLHFVPAEALRWMLRLLTPRIAAGLAWRNRQLELDAKGFTKATKILTRALEGGRCLSRPAAYAELERGGMATSEQRGIHILSYLALSGHLCFGEREGRQPTFVLLDEWIPRGQGDRSDEIDEIDEIDDDEAFARLAETYFRGHGPATLADFAWWTGLRVVEAKRAIEIAGERLRCEQRAGVARYSLAETPAAFGAGETPPPPRRRTRGPSVELLPPWDEYLVGYRDRTAALGHLPDHLDRKLELLGRPVVLVDGRARGFWRRELSSETVRVSVELWDEPIVETGAVRRGVEQAAERYAAFLGRELELVVRSRCDARRQPKPAPSPKHK